jgi:cytochrome c6
VKPLTILLAILLCGALNLGLGFAFDLPGLAAPEDSTALISTPQLVETALETPQLFETHCAGCHIHGGNIVRRGKNLKLKALQKYHMDTVEAISQIITLGKGNMSAYQDRLSAEQIQALAAYVLEQANQNWPS